MQLPWRFDFNKIHRPSEGQMLLVFMNRVTNQSYWFAFWTSSSNNYYSYLRVTDTSTWIMQ